MTDREKFEAWLTDGEGELHKMLLTDKYDSGAYRLGKSENQWQAWQAALAYQKPEDDGWIEWNGGQCPVRADAIVDIKFRDGIVRLKDVAQWIWTHAGDKSDIIAYRVMKP